MAEMAALISAVKLLTAESRRFHFGPSTSRSRGSSLCAPSSPKVRRKFCLIGALDDDSLIGIQFCFYLIFYCFSSSIKIDVERFRQRSFSSSKHRCQHFYLILQQQFKISTFTRILQFTPVTLHLLIIRKFTSLNSNFT